MGFDLPLELVCEVFGRSEFASLRVAAGLRLDDPQEKGFKLAQVLVADREIDAESVPMRGEAVLQVRVQSPAKVTRQPYIIELAASIQCVNPLPSQDVSADNVQVLFERISADVFKVLAAVAAVYDRRRRS